jgi:hypothetical protein
LQSGFFFIKFDQQQQQQPAAHSNDAEFEYIDIKDFNLPLLDESVPPSQGQYSK